LPISFVNENKLHALDVTKQLYGSVDFKKCCLILREVRSKDTTALILWTPMQHKWSPGF